VVGLFLGWASSLIPAFVWRLPVSGQAGPRNRRPSALPTRRSRLPNGPDCRSALAGAGSGCSVGPGSRSISAAYRTWLPLGSGGLSVSATHRPGSRSASAAGRTRLPLGFRGFVELGCSSAPTVVRPSLAVPAAQGLCGLSGWPCRVVSPVQPGRVRLWPGLPRHRPPVGRLRPARLLPSAQSLAAGRLGRLPSRPSPHPSPPPRRRPPTPPSPPRPEPRLFTRTALKPVPPGASVGPTSHPRR